jgi:hypothetical protein
VGLAQEAFALTALLEHDNHDLNKDDSERG